MSRKTASRILFLAGLALAIGELYKQIFLTVFINHGNYDWWYFPFQLCSVPMYLCLIQYPLRSTRLRTVICTFMRDFHIMSGIAALAVPAGFSHIHWSLTLHGYCWHILLILIGLFCHAAGLTDNSRQGYLHSLPLFVLCCGIATAVNLLAPGHGTADMFYISPYHPSVQPIVHELALTIGILPANLLYLAAICLGAALTHALFAIARLPLSCRK
ncbi:MAG: YwaF family protein [Clostridiales bacterium]|nr:YwaF family protein [Clostridiales bacterium]